MKKVDGIMRIRRAPMHMVSIAIRCEDENRVGAVWRYGCMVVDSCVLDGIDHTLRKAREQGFSNILIETGDHLSCES